MRSLPLIGLVAAATIAVAACSSGGGSGPSASAPASGASARAATTDALAGRTFLSTGATGHELAPGSTIRLSFEETAP